MHSKVTWPLLALAAVLALATASNYAKADKPIVSGDGLTVVDSSVAGGGTADVVSGSFSPPVSHPVLAYKVQITITGAAASTIGIQRNVNGSDLAPEIFNGGTALQPGQTAGFTYMASREAIGASGGDVAQLFDLFFGTATRASYDIYPLEEGGLK